MSNAATIAAAAAVVIVVVDIWAVPYVIELQLKLSNLNVLLRKFVLQSPQLVLLPEEHPQELQSTTYRFTHTHTYIYINTSQQGTVLAKLSFQ